MPPRSDPHIELAPAKPSSNAQVSMPHPWQKFARGDWLFEASVQSHVLQIQTAPSPNWLRRLLHSVERQ